MEEVKEKLKGQGFTRNEMKAVVRSFNFFDGLTVYLSKWNWDNYKSWHLYSWEDSVDEAVMKAIYEAEQFHPFSCGRYKGDFEQFEKDWKDEVYDPGATLAFEDGQVEVLEVLQEEVNNIDPEEVKREMNRAQNAKRDQQRKRRMKASKGSRYQKKYF
jgi:hypothetical protein